MKEQKEEIQKEEQKEVNKKGFTLIELLAVIVILAVLMITAIPAVTAAIAKSRRDTYATNSKKIIDAVRTAVINEEFVTGGHTCQLPGIGEYIEIDLLPSGGSVINQLLERGGQKSSFNQQYKAGTVWIVNEGTGTTDKYVYYITLIDDGNNGINTTTPENEVLRNKVIIGKATTKGSKPTTASGTAYTCTYSG